jgi:hypothetical protein
MAPADLVTQWRQEAEHVRPYNAGAAHAYEEAARQLEEALGATVNQLLTLAEAATRSGYNRDSLARLVRRGKLRNYGTPRQPLVRANDLPKKAERPRLTLACGPLVSASQ